MGILAKETPVGPFATEWQAAYAGIKSEMEEVDVTNAFSAAAMSVKDENELVGPLYLTLVSPTNRTSALFATLLVLPAAYWPAILSTK